MKIVLWSLLALFLIGDALFVLPWHVSSDKVTSVIDVSYKKDSLLLKKVFPDTAAIHVRLNLPPLYAGLYKKTDSSRQNENDFYILVNASVLHNLDFTALAFPFYKVTTFNCIIPFSSIIKASNAPDMDSTALVGNITVNGKVAIKGISSPVYARELVEKELLNILRQEMNKVEVDINRKPTADSSLKVVETGTPAVKNPGKRKRR